MGKKHAIPHYARFKKLGEEDVGTHIEVTVRIDFPSGVHEIVRVYADVERELRRPFAKILGAALESPDSLIRSYAKHLNDRLSKDGERASAQIGYYLGWLSHRVQTLGLGPALLKVRSFDRSRKGKSKLTDKQNERCIDCYRKYCDEHKSHHKACLLAAEWANSQFSLKDNGRVSWRYIDRLVDPKV